MVVVDKLHVIMMSFCGSRGTVPSPVFKPETEGRSRACIPAGLEAAELLYCICIVFICVVYFLFGTIPRAILVDPKRSFRHALNILKRQKKLVITLM